MELGRLRLGVYTTNVLVDLDLPRGARVTVEAFDDDDLPPAGHLRRGPRPGLARLP
jgi:hypothetical protein